MKILITLIFSLVLSIAQGQYTEKKVAKSDRSYWSLPLNSSIDFDVASKCEMLVFIEVFNTYATYSEDKIKQLTHLENINKASVENWKSNTQKILLENINSLHKESLNSILQIPSKITWETLSNLNIESKIPEKLTNWYKNSHEFYHTYISEQIRLAALHPKITSEITTLNPNEITGKEFSQKHFLLTFDDGPTPSGGNTDKTIEMLKKHNLQAIFFVLGEALQNRMKATSVPKLKNVYATQTIASHGKEHKSHQKLATWQHSIDFTTNLIHQISDISQVNFRPPYGQRTKEVAQYLQKSGSKVVLWNLDSQDWNQKMDAQQVADRQITLMLLWRRGILLFHDIHPKAQKAVPLIYNYFKKCKVVWASPNYVDQL